MNKAQWAARIFLLILVGAVGPMMISCAEEKAADVTILRGDHRVGRKVNPMAEFFINHPIPLKVPGEAHA